MEAVIGLPYRMLILTVVGLAGFSALISAFPSCIIPEPVHAVILGSDVFYQDEVDVRVKVMDRKGNPVGGANVIIFGYGGGGSNLTDEKGITIVHVDGVIVEGEGYLKLLVRAGGCYQEYENDFAIKVWSGGNTFAHLRSLRFPLPTPNPFPIFL